MQHLNQSFYRLRSGLTILPSHQKDIDQLLSKLVQQLPARFVLLTDVTGQLISARGEQNKVDLVALGSLVAGDLAASQEIARLIGEHNDYQLVLREGQVSNTFICESGKYLAMMVQVSNEVPMGWARMMIQDSAHKLTNILEKEPEKNSQVVNPMETGPVLQEENLSDLFDNELDDLFGQSS